MPKPMIQIWNTEKEGIYQVDIDTKVITKDKAYEIIGTLSDIHFNKESEVQGLKVELETLRTIREMDIEKLQKENEEFKQKVKDAIEKVRSKLSPTTTGCRAFSTLLKEELNLE